MQLRSFIKATLPTPVSLRLLQLESAHKEHGQWRPWLRVEALWRTKPIRPAFGWGSGQSIARYYIDQFLSRYTQDIHGWVLEIADNKYTRRFGGTRVVQSDVLHVRQGRPSATIIADLTDAPHIPSNTFDCIILTQTLQFIYDTPATIKTLHRILKPGGVLLVTVPGISQLSRHDMDRWGEYWRFTTLSMRKLFSERFPEDAVTIEAYGNVLASTAFLHGLLARECSRAELDYRDRDYEMLITLRAVKPRESAEQRRYPTYLGPPFASRCA
jgi:SAM-dependent methyltransferase